MPQALKLNLPLFAPMSNSQTGREGSRDKLLAEGGGKCQESLANLS